MKVSTFLFIPLFSLVNPFVPYEFYPFRQVYKLLDIIRVYRLYLRFYSLLPLAYIYIPYSFIIGEGICFQTFIYSLKEFSLLSFKLSNNLFTMTRLWRIHRYFIGLWLLQCRMNILFFKKWTTSLWNLLRKWYICSLSPSYIWKLLLQYNPQNRSFNICSPITQYLINNWFFNYWNTWY